MSWAHRAVRRPALGPGILLAGLASMIWIGGGALAAPPEGTEVWLFAPALHGMTGLINTPTAYTLPSGALRMGYGRYDREWAYTARDTSDNFHYFVTFGFISRVEVSIRASFFPDVQPRELTERGTVDRGGNARVQVIPEGRHRPAIALGIDDIRGTRRFHALYVVGSKTFTEKSEFLRLRLSAGYGSDVLKADTYVLDGLFGGAECLVGSYGSLAAEYDTEKWNASLRLQAFHHLTVYVALLNLEAPGGGAAWTHRFQ